MDVVGDVVGNVAKIEAGGDAEVEGGEIKQATESERGKKDDPEASKTLQEVAGPGPGVRANGTEDVASDEVAAHDEEENHSLVAEGAECVGESPESAMMGDEVGVVDEEEIAPMAEADEQSSDGAYEIEQKRGEARGEVGRGGGGRLGHDRDGEFTASLQEMMRGTARHDGIGSPVPPSRCGQVT